MGSASGISIHIDHLACMWKVEMKRKDNIKREGRSERGRSENPERNIVASRINSVIETVRNI